MSVDDWGYAPLSDDEYDAQRRDVARLLGLDDEPLEGDDVEQCARHGRYVVHSIVDRECPHCLVDELLDEPLPPVTARDLIQHLPLTRETS